MLLLLKNEMTRISKRKILFIYLGSITVILIVTAIVVMGLGTDGEILEFLRQNGLELNEPGDKWYGWEFVASLFAIIFTKAAFLLFEAYLISTIIIDEFRKKTINQLFSYPVSKTKIIWSKIILVALISFISQFSAHLIIQLGIKIMAYFNGVQYFFTFNSLWNLSYTTLGIIFLGLLPFVFGMMGHSIVLTMLSSLILCSLVSNSISIRLANGFINSVPFIFFISIVSLTIIAISIKRVSKKDVCIY